MVANYLKGPVAVLYGGQGAEREVSLASGQAVFDALQAQGIPSVLIDCRLSNVAAQLIERAIKHVFIALHGGFGENGALQAILESLSITYTGSTVMASALAMDKWRTKLVWQSLGIPTPSFCMASPDTDWLNVRERLGKRCVIKPSREGSSIGISLVEDEKTFQEALEHALACDSDVIIEQYIQGNEYTVSIVNDIALPVVQLQTTRAFYDYHAKYEAHDTQYRCPSDLEPAMEKQVQHTAMRAFKALGCEGWGRLDVMFDEQGYYFLEANTSPGMTSHSLLPMAAKAYGMSFQALVETVLRVSITKDWCFDV